jgi:NitT/TauT family transport system ATP-binding protein
MPWRTVLQNVLLPIEILRRDVAAYREQATALLALMGLRGFEHATPRELSGGMSSVRPSAEPSSTTRASS